MTVAEEARRSDKHEDRRARWRTIAFVAAALLLAAIGIIYVQANNRAETAADAAKAGTFSLAQQVAAACSGPNVNDKALKQLCDSAKQIVREGPPGPEGPIGPAGPAGPQGPQGPAGPQGAAGTNGTNGTNGVDGANGANGTNGSNGVDGEPGTTGANGSDGAAGPPGPAGPAGADGKNGTDGRGVASIDCDKGNATLVFTFTDGSTQTVECNGPTQVP